MQKLFVSSILQTAIPKIGFTKKAAVLYHFNMKTKQYLMIRVIASFLAVNMLFCAGAVVIGLWIINGNVYKEAYERMKQNAVIAEYAYEQNRLGFEAALSDAANLPTVRRAFAAGSETAIKKALEAAKKDLNADLIGFIKPESFPSTVLQCAEYASERREACSGTEVLSDEMLEAEIPDWEDRKKDKSAQSAQVERKALALTAACPVFAGERFAGLVYGAFLINNNSKLTDTIKNLIFGNESGADEDTGIAAILLDNTVISVNGGAAGIQPVGTRLADDIYEELKLSGYLWSGSDRRCIFAYRPIYDMHKNISGLLQVGVTESRYDSIKLRTSKYFAGLMLAIGLVALWLAVCLLRKLIRPIKDLINAANSVSQGNFDVRITREYKGEIGDLCATFNQMAEAVGKLNRQIQDDAKNQILQSEKMASIGRLAAAVAHELNNPLTGILTYGNIMLEELQGTKYAEDLKIVTEEAVRCRDIVHRLLDFSREKRLDVKRYSLSTLVSESVSVLEKTYGFRDVQIEKHIDYSVPETNMDISQMKSVINNLITNAVDAMSGNGILKLATWYDSEKNSVCLRVSDNGSGIKKENIDLIFEPFFTTKDVGKGTGLGLFVTTSIIENHGGSISVKSEEGGGTEFTVELPVR